MTATGMAANDLFEAEHSGEEVRQEGREDRGAEGRRAGRHPGREVI